MARELFYSTNGATWEAPTALLTDTSSPRQFTAGVDPQTFPQITLATGDIWWVSSNGYGYGNGGYGMTPYGS
jgi:hypothetical protein